MSENLKCPCCAKEPLTKNTISGGISAACQNSGCMMFGRYFPLPEYNNPALRIAEREAEKRGVARGKSAGIKLALSICDQAYHQSQHDADVQVTPESFACNEAVSDCKKQIQSLLK